MIPRTVQHECPKCGKLNSSTSSWLIRSPLAKNIMIYSFKCTRCKHHWKEGIHYKVESKRKIQKTTEIEQWE